MSRKQTRASVSLERDLGLELYAFAEAHGTSASQVAMRGIRAVLSGEIALGETIDPHQLGIRTADKRRGLTAEQMAARLHQRDKDRTRHAALRDRRAEQGPSGHEPITEQLSRPVPTVRLTPIRFAPSVPRPFCAICTNEIAGDPLRLPLGKADALVNVCLDCQMTAPKERDHLFGQSGNGVGRDSCGEGNRRSGVGR